MTNPETLQSSRAWTVYPRELWSRREFAFFLAMGNLRARNASTALGLVWWVLNPLLLAAVYFVVFGLLLGSTRGDEPAFLAWLLSGMFAFNYTSQSMMGGANSILHNERLLVNLRFPRLILPMSAIVEAGTGFLASMGIYYLIVGPANNILPTVSLLLLPGVFVIHTLFNLGLATTTARMAVPFRDINNVIPHFMRFWLYLSPVIWTLGFLDGAPTWASNLLRANPMFSFLSLYRTALMGRPFELDMLLTASAWAVVLCVVGLYSFTRFEAQMVRYL